MLVFSMILPQTSSVKNEERMLTDVTISVRSAASLAVLRRWKTVSTLQISWKTESVKLEKIYLLIFTSTSSRNGLHQYHCHYMNIDDIQRPQQRVTFKNESCISQFVTHRNKIMDVVVFCHVGVRRRKVIYTFPTSQNALSFFFCC